MGGVAAAASSIGSRSCGVQLAGEMIMHASRCGCVFQCICMANADSRGPPNQHQLVHIKFCRHTKRAHTYIHCGHRQYTHNGQTHGPHKLTCQLASQPASQAASKQAGKYLRSPCKPSSRPSPHVTHLHGLLLCCRCRCLCCCQLPLSFLQQHITLSTGGLKHFHLLDAGGPRICRLGSSNNKTTWGT